MALLTRRAWRMLRPMSRAFVIAAALAAAAGALGGLAGCRDQQLEELREIRKEVCACKTPACAEAVMKRVPQDEIKSEYRAQRIANEMMECLAKLYIADKPSTDPDAEAKETKETKEAPSR